MEMRWIQKVKKQLQRCYICLTMGGTEMVMDVGTQKIPTLRSPEAWQLKSKEESMAHWKYVESVLMSHQIPLHEINICGLHYKAAFEHGYGHGAEDQALGRIKFEHKV